MVTDRVGFELPLYDANMGVTLGGAVNIVLFLLASRVACDIHAKSYALLNKISVVTMSRSHVVPSLGPRCANAQRGPQEGTTL
jgi:hypothetical protein